jgi:ABC-type amino acid transport substrate-binding protein
VYDAPPLMYASKLDQSIKVVGKMFDPQDYAVVFPNTGAEELKEIFNFEIMESKKDGTYQKIYGKWFR